MAYIRMSSSAAIRMERVFFYYNTGSHTHTHTRAMECTHYITLSIESIDMLTGFRS